MNYRTTRKNRPVGDDAITVIRFPIRLVSLVCLLTIIACAWFGWFIFEARPDAKMFTDQLVRIEELRGVIIHLDEVLTMSARTTAVTGDLQWEERYRRFEPQLDAAIKETTKLGTGPSDVKAATKTDGANIKLVEMENRAFALVHAGRKEEAQTILFSPEFEAQKQIYAEGIMSFASQIRRKFDQRFREDQLRDLLSIIAAMVVGGISSAWWSAARSVRGWRAQLLDSFNRRVEAEENLRQAHAELEVRVKERTAELANVNHALQTENTERKRGEEALRASEERYRSLFEGNPNPMWVFDSETLSFLAVNDAAVRHYGYSREEFLTMSLKDIRPPEDVPALMDALSGGEAMTSSIRCRHRRKDRSLIDIEVTSHVLVWGGRHARVALINDVTEREAVEKQLRDADKKYRSIFDNALEGIFQSTPNGAFISANPAFARMLGFASPEELIRERNDITRQSYAEPAKREEFKRLLEECGVVNNFELEVKRKDGVPIWLSENVRIVRDAAGNALYYEGSVQDITEHKRSEARVREQANLLNLSQDAIMVRGMDDRIEFWNHGAEVLYGWTAEEVRERLSGDFLNYEEPVKILAERTLLETGTWSGECRHLTKRGDTVIVRSRWTLVRDEQGQPKSKLVITTDITEQKKIEEQFLRAQRLESIGTLASGVAHDLNNVLVPIMMAAPALRGKIDSAERERFLDIIESSAHRGADIIKQVLTFARGADGDRILLQPIYLLEEISKIAGQTFPKSIALRTYYDENIRSLEADPTQLHQVFLNLCINARDAMPNGGELCLGAENFDVDEHYASMTPGATVGPHVMLQITDSGSGIPRHVIDKIFDPFFTTKSIGQGTGLGLSTVAGIVKSHGGFIHVDSEPGHTSFKVFLPAKETLDTSSTLQVDALVPRGNGQTILLVDDEPTIREVAEVILKSYGYKVLVAEDSPSALALFAQHLGHIAVVVTDLAMPGMDGLMLVRTLRQIEPALKVIVSTGRTDDSHAAEIASLNVDSCLTKPYTTRNLLLKLSHVLQSLENAA